jgi:tetratricopeptide (TPR) repeat protein
MRRASRAWWLGIAALAAVFVLKLALALQLTGHPLLQPVGELDTGEYWRLAQRVLGGDAWLTGTAFHLSPLYIYWLAMALGIAGGTTTGVLVVQALAGTAAVALAASTAARWTSVGDDSSLQAGRPAIAAACVAGGAVALTGVVALQETLVLQSALDALLIALCAWTWTSALLRGGDLRWSFCGVAFALCATNRPNAWLVAPLLVAATLARPAETPGRGSTWRRATAWIAGVVLVLVPFAVRSRVAVGEWQVLPGHGGLNLYIGNHDGATGTYTVVEGIRPSIEGQRDDARRVAEAATGRSLSDAEVSGWFVGRAVSWWREAPVRALHGFAYKAWLATHAWELPVNVSYGWFREQVGLLRVLPVGAWLLLPLGLATLALGPRLVPDARQSAWAWFRLLFPAYLLSVAVFFVVDRYRAPALVLAAIHVGVLAGRVRASSPVRVAAVRAVVAGAVALVAAIAAQVPLPFDLGHGDADLGMALHAIEQGRDTEADAWLNRATVRMPSPGVGWFRAGLAWQARGALAPAERALREAHRRDPDVAEVAFALAGVLLSQGKGAEAAPLLASVERAGVHQDRIRLDRALALWQAGDRDGARQLLDAGVPAAGLPLLRARALAAADARQVELAAWLLGVFRAHVQDDAEVAERLGLMRVELDDEAGAGDLFAHAARLDPSRATARFNLAIVRVRQGRRDDAIALLREALRIDPTYAQAAGALRELLEEKSAGPA